MTNELTNSKLNETENTGYMPQLDSLRAIAVFFVLLEHWLNEIPLLKLFPFGMSGVTLFFVLSGFLITQILLKSRDLSEQKNQNRIHSAKQFYIRRTLRIFPVYYLTILILYIFNVQNIRDKILWFLFYASNIYFFKINNWDGNLSHLWTLAVEEQFYIIWPFIILFIPKKYLINAILGIILSGPVFRTALFILGDGSQWSSSFIHILTPSCMDCFGLGALLAFYRVNTDKFFQFTSKKAKIFLILNIISFMVLLFLEENFISVFLFRFNVSLISLFIISKVSLGYTGFLKIIFENKMLMYLGKISYGMYLFHNFIPLIYKSLKLPPVQNLFLKFSVQFILLVITASLSWFLLEKPVNNLKKYFKYN